MGHLEASAAAQAIRNVIGAGLHPAPDPPPLTSHNHTYWLKPESDLGFAPIKINAVAAKGLIEPDIVPLARRLCTALLGLLSRRR